MKYHYIVKFRSLHSAAKAGLDLRTEVKKQILPVKLC